jgi:hypothetical protein
MNKSFWKGKKVLVTVDAGFKAYFGDRDILKISTEQIEEYY